MSIIIVKCVKCGQEYEYNLNDGYELSDLQCECGGDLKIKKYSKNQLNNWYNKLSTPKRGLLVGITAICALFIFLGFAYVGGGTTTNSVTISNDHYIELSSSNHNHEFTAELTPHENFNYLKVVLVWYDSSNKIIDTDTVWSELSVVKEQTYLINSTSSLSANPTKVKILVFDSRSNNENEAIYTRLVTFT